KSWFQDVNAQIRLLLSVLGNTRFWR
ncbi:MAG: hypothetical protein QOJ56_5879, partial [Mycobacterium sp.]|nr:hypothetical protein [Mycobacterium sp.]